MFFLVGVELSHAMVSTGMQKYQPIQEVCADVVFQVPAHVESYQSMLWLLSCSVLACLPQSVLLGRVGLVGKVTREVEGGG